ncbi:MAG: TonB-dependent receptor domain-containing protein [Pyrinomonadaceae bacterium]
MKNVLKFFSLSVLVASFALFTGSVFAQTSTTGSIEGNVTDVNGAAVPGVTITVTSPNLIRAQTATTNDSGHYQIPTLPPGKYSVVVESTKGFAKFDQANVEVNLSKTSSVDITLQPAGASATVTVTETAGAAIDVNSNTTGTSVSSDQFSNFPTARTVQGLYNIAPTTARSGLRDASGRDRDPSVQGASGPENNYILDGVNTTDPAFGGSGANLPFEFVQEVEVKTGSYSAEYGRSTGGIFNVITKSGGNEFHGDLFGYFTTKSLVREVKHLPFTGSAANGFSEADIGGDIGGPIVKDKLWFFAAFNPQNRKNFYLTQTFHQQVSNKVKTPFYAGKLTYSLNQNNTLTFSTFGDFTKIDGFLATGALTNASGFGTDPAAFIGRQETGGHNYAARWNSTITPRMILELSGGLHFQRANTFPQATDQPLINDTFAILSSSGSVLPVTQSGILFGSSTGFLDFVFAPAGTGTLQRNFLRGPGFGLFGPQKRNRYELAARLQNFIGKHTVKYGFEASRNRYNIDTFSSGPQRTFPNPNGLPIAVSDNLTVNGYRVASNSFSVCAVVGTQILCPSSTAFSRVNALFGAGALPASITGVQNAAITSQQANTAPFLVRLSTRVRDFELHAKTYTDVESFYVQDDWKLTKSFQINVGGRWDYQQSYSNGGGTYIKLNNFKDNFQPRLGFTWDFTGKGKGKLFANYSQVIETPIPLDTNVRAGGGDTQTDKNFNVSTYGAGAGAFVVPGISSSLAAVNLGSDATPIDPGLKPQKKYEWAAGLEYEIARNLTFGMIGHYSNYLNVIEDGSFDDGNNYFLFNPGRRGNGETTEDLACADPTIGCFGPARRYYRAIEFSATKRFSNNYQFIASYVYSSLIGNYEGLFRNDNGQSDPNITSLFDLVSLLSNTYGRLPNDRPHQFKFNGSYTTPWRLVVSGNFYAQSGVPFNQLIPHPIYGNNEGFAVPRGTAIVPNTGATVPGGSGGVENAIGNSRTPFTTNLDMGVYYPWKISENKQLRFTLDWFNVFNSQRAVTLDQTFSINSGITGVAPVPNNFYGSGLIFQFPSSVRFGAKFQF